MQKKIFGILKRQNHALIFSEENVTINFVIELVIEIYFPIKCSIARYLNKIRHKSKT
jgi:hypothetical protein